jgi:hypothetical protein
VLLHVVVHLSLLLCRGLFFLAFLELLLFILLQISLALLVDLVVETILFLLEHQVVLISVLLVKFLLFLWRELLPEVMPPSLGQGDDAGLLFAGPPTDLSAVAGLDDLSPPLLYLPILDLGCSLVLLVEVVMQQQRSRELLFLFTL